MSITNEEARAKSNEKIQQIKELAAKLKVRMTAEQAIRNNMIKNVILYTDEEAYDIEPPKPIVRSALPPMPPRAKALAGKKGEAGKEEVITKAPNVQDKENNILSDETTIPQ